MRSAPRLACLSLALLLAAPATSAAEDYDYNYEKSDWPLATVDRPLTLAKGMFELSGDTVTVGMTKGNTGKPIELAPDLYVGISHRFSVGITHDGGICLGGDAACPQPYRGVGLDTLYSVARGGNLGIAMRIGATAPALGPADATTPRPPFTAGLNLGLVGRLRVGKLAMVVAPLLYIGVVERANRAETLDIPVTVQYQMLDQTLLFVRTGLRSPFEGFADEHDIPFGFGGSFALNNRFDVGAEFAFTNIVGSGGNADERVLIARAALRL